MQSSVVFHFDGLIFFFIISHILYVSLYYLLSLSINCQTIFDSNCNVLIRLWRNSGTIFSIINNNDPHYSLTYFYVILRLLANSQLIIVTVAIRASISTAQVQCQNGVGFNSNAYVTQAIVDRKTCDVQSLVYFQSVPMSIHIEVLIPFHDDGSTVIPDYFNKVFRFSILYFLSVLYSNYDSLYKDFEYKTAR